MGVVPSEVEDFKSNLKDYFFKFQDKKSLKTAITEQKVHSGVIISKEQLLDGKTIKKLAQDGKLKAGDFFELKIPPIGGPPNVRGVEVLVPLIWTGKNIYSYNAKIGNMELYSE